MTRNDEDIVDRKRLLDDVAGEKLESEFRPEPEVHTQVEKQRERDPNPRPAKRLADA